MAFSSADLDTIRTAIASGTMRVRFADGRELTYQSLDQLMEAEKRIAGAVARASGNHTRIRTPAYRNGC